MSTSRHHDRNQTWPDTSDERQVGEVSRRTILAGAVAAAAAVSASDVPAYARGASPDSREDMMAFLVLSAALTGVHVSNLAPEFSQADLTDPKKKVPILDADPGTDPFNVKNDYFKWINASDAATFEKLLQIARDHSTSAPEIISQEIIRQVNASDDTKYLARSIVLLWYLGSWYKPKDLENSLHPDPKAPRAPIPSQVVSAKAYTQGLVWQIAQAHPMGYSNLQFGYWSRDPVDPSDKNSSPSVFITSTIP
jgi:hypothetical protein